MRLTLWLLLLLPAGLCSAAESALPARPAASHPITRLLSFPAAARTPLQLPASRPLHLGDAATTPTAASRPLGHPATRPMPFDAKRPLDLNRATAAELAALPGLDATRAAIIVQFRQTYGPFRSIEDLIYVQGISQARLDLFRDLVEVHPPAPPAQSPVTPGILPAIR